MPDSGVLTRLGTVFENALEMPAPAADEDIIAGGMLDSLGLVTLLFEIEQEFDVQIALEEVDLEDVRTLERLAGLVAGLSGGGRGTITGSNGAGPDT